ncbi:unnamed protein product [Echinostoma caproni]|uniref:tRNA(Ile)-lysidine/2-thiocytidine synthase N-terminal domain-containing protein n=1 Tax=Echinostoma caproni TaxID=27848 RepID=A0A3P8L4L1_9TREM|nr:unnamed protein product [Echinostoma caproni]
MAVSNPNPSPWHPGSLVSCFCPDLQNPSHESNPTLALAKASSSNSSVPDRLLNKCSSDLPASVQQLEGPVSVTPFNYSRYRVKDITINSITVIPHRKGKHSRTRSVSDVQVHDDQLQLCSAQVRSADVEYDSGVDGISSPIQLSLNNEITYGARQSVTEKLDVCPQTDQYEECQSPLGTCSSVEMTNNHHGISASPVANRSTPSESDRCICSFASSESSKPPTRSTSTSQSSLWRTPPKPFFKSVLRAIRQFSMIQPGDRVLVCLSGGKDSMSMLHALHQYQIMLQRGSPETTPASFHLGAVTVDPGTSAYDPRPLIPYLAELGVEYYYEKQGQSYSYPFVLFTVVMFHICSFITLRVSNA